MSIGSESSVQAVFLDAENLSKLMILYAIEPFIGITVKFRKY